MELLSWQHILRRERKLRGMSQADVAEEIGCDSKTVGRWEREGDRGTFPSPYHIQKLVKLFNKQHAGELGLVEESPAHPQSTAEQVDQTGIPSLAVQSANTRLIPDKEVQQRPRREVWGDAPQIMHEYGRESELAEAERWIVTDRCRILAVTGMGGTGKTTFAKMLAEQVKASFDYVAWYSLQNAPPLERLLEHCGRFLSDETARELPQDLDEAISFCVRLFREQRCLLILDNVESIFLAGQHSGVYLARYESYGKLFQALGEAPHQSCLLLTSREKPKEIAHREGTTSPVRSFLLPGVKAGDIQKLLGDRNLFGSDAAWITLTELYSGNPLALQLVAVSIREVFGGDIAAFLEEGETVFGDIQNIVAQHIQRLSTVEQYVMIWLAIERQPVAMHVLREDCAQLILKNSPIDTLNSLRRRALIETTDDHRYMLQPVIMEYMTRMFVEHMYTDIIAEQTTFLAKFAFIKTQAHDYVRDSQARLLLTPVVENLRATQGSEGSTQKLKRMLARLHQEQDTEYAAGNILNLLAHSGADLHGLDCSHLIIRQAYFQGVELPGVNFGGATFVHCVFTDTFAWILCVAVSPTGDVLAIGTTTGEVRVLRVADGRPVFTGIGHTDEIRAVAFRSDGELLVSGSEDNTIRIWDMRTGICRHVLSGHRDFVRAVSFCSDGRFLVSGGEDGTVRLWDSITGEQVRIFEEQSKRVRAVACQPQSSLVASGGDDHKVHLWDSATGKPVATLSGHTNNVCSLAFSPDGLLLASGGEDRAVHLWDISTGKIVAVLTGHTDRVRTIAFGSDGRLASGSDDTSIRLWDSSSGQLVTVIHGHSSRVWSLSFAPGSSLLMSASEDDTLRWWEVPSGRCLRTLQGYTDLIKSVAFHPQGHMVASGSEDRTVRLWNRETGQCLKVLRGHANRIRAVAFHPEGTIVASGSEDETIRLWDTHTGSCLNVLRGHTHLVRAVAFNTTGEQLISGSHDETVRLWNVRTGRLLKVLRGHQGYVWCALFHPKEQRVVSGGDDMVIHLWDVETGAEVQTLTGHTGRIWSLAFDAQGQYLASSSDDLTIRLWDMQTGRCLRILTGHTDWVRAIALSPDGTLLASGSHDTTIRLWSVATGTCNQVLVGHVGWIWSVAFDYEGRYLVSGSDDSTIRIWDVARGKCVQTCIRKRPYDGMNIAETQGLAEGEKAALRFLGAFESSEAPG